MLPASARERPHPGVRYVSLVDAPEVELVLVRPSRGAHPLAERFEQAVRLAAARPDRP